MMNKVKTIFNKITPKKLKPRVLFFENLGELPFYNWRLVHETGDLSNIIKEGKIEDSTREEIVGAWHNLNNEYLKKFGLDLNTKIILQRRKQLALSIANYIETLDLSYEMEADIIKIDIAKDNENKGVSISYIELIAQVEESRGIPINERELSTEMFFTYYKIIKDRNKNKINFKAS